MQCPRCKTNNYGNNSKCTVCGYILTNVVSTDNTKEETKISNGILDPKDTFEYGKKLEYYKQKNKEPNIIIPIILILIIVIIIIIIALLKFLNS